MRTKQFGPTREQKLAQHKKMLQNTLARYRRNNGDPQQALEYLMIFVNGKPERFHDALKTFAVELYCCEYAEEMKK